jgi:flagellar basal body-associated protein FliL
MGESSSKKKSKFLMLIVIAVIVVVVVSVVVYRSYVGVPASSQLSDPANDVVLSIGTQYPGMIDVVGGTLEVNGTTLNVTIDVRDAFTGLGERETAQWNVTVILENETEVLKTYEITVNMNSAGLTAYIVDVDTQSAQSCQVSYQSKSLTVQAVVDELPSAKTIEWNILTSYEQYSADELITSASDLAPDEGLQKTVLNP